MIPKSFSALVEDWRGFSVTEYHKDLYGDSSGVLAYCADHLEQLIQNWDERIDLSLSKADTAECIEVLKEFRFKVLGIRANNP